MKFIFVSKKVQDTIKALQKNGKAETTLAGKAKEIIDGLASVTARYHGDEPGALTRYGEKRIRNCRKYDLGCGYRLITLQRGNSLYVTYLGTHDEAQRWLEHHSRLKNFHAGAGWAIRSVEKKQTGMIPAMSKCIGSTAADDDRFEHLSDKDLRVVFSGLVEQARGNHASEKAD